MNFNFRLLVILLCVCLVGIFSCSNYKSNLSFVGTWRGVIDSPGGELPFTIEVTESDEKGIKAIVRNGEESLPFSDVNVTGKNVRFFFDHYDSYLEGALNSEETEIKGQWSRRALGDTRTIMKFAAFKDQKFRFQETVTSTNQKNISGEWTVKFSDTIDDSKALAIFEQQGKKVTGTFLTTIGDYRFLEGTFQENILQLSVFDGAHAFLFKATLDEDNNLKGDFWSRDTYHTSWTATKGKIEMTDAFSLTKLTNNQQHFTFNFPDVNGKMISHKDPRFLGKALLVYIFGTWCPNCNDEAPFLVDLYKKYHNQGLEIVGLANEFSEDFDKNSEMVKRFAEKYTVPWPLLIVGIADKNKTTAALSDLDKVISYPTTLFIDNQGKVQKIHTGFAGPGTGKHYKKLQQDFNGNIKTILED
jgi:thiol-disulfide isomerase/thioredoxin